MLIQRIYESYNLAILEGIITFAENEGMFSKEINECYRNYFHTKNEEQKNRAIQEYNQFFNHFLGVFRIQRGFPVVSRNSLIKFIFDKYLNSIEIECKPVHVQDFAIMACEKGLSRGIQISAFSKIAFIFKPFEFYPYDSTARNSLNMYIYQKGLAYSIEKNYVDYMKAVDLLYNELVNNYEILINIKNKQYLKGFQLNQKRFEHKYEKFLNNCEILGIKDVEGFIAKRALDKSLMLCGGFNTRNLIVVKEEILKHVDTFGDLCKD